MENAIVEFADDLYTQQVLDKGQVRLLNQMGSDLSVVAAARVSNGESYEEASHGVNKDARLINYLVKHRHGTPFEHATFQFYVKTPLFVRSEWHRHRMASYNEISGRYVKYDPEFYLPASFRVQSEDNKQGSVFPEDMNIVDLDTKELLFDEDYTLDEWNSYNAYILKRHAEQSFQLYETFVDRGVAKEMARMVLPPNLYTQFYMTINARSLMNFLSLRAAEDAQWEIRQYALAMKEMFKEAMPLTYKAWEGNGFIAP